MEPLIDGIQSFDSQLHSGDRVVEPGVTAVQGGVRLPRQGLQIFQVDIRRELQVKVYG
jgi:hypothetical protein